MDKENAVTADELASEQQALAEVKEEEIRASIIEEMGFDETADKERIDKLVKKDIEGRKKLSQTIGQKIKYRTQANEAKAKKQEVKTEEKKEETSDLSQRDLLALSRANIADEDIDEVIEYAKFKKISISEALKSSVIKTTLADKAEFRKTADASNTGGSRRAPVKPTVDKLLTDLDEGKVPDPGSSEAEEIYWAKRGGKPAKR